MPQLHVKYCHANDIRTGDDTKSGARKRDGPKRQFQRLHIEPNPLQGSNAVCLMIVSA